MDLRNKIKKCESCITCVSAEITAKNRRPVEPTWRSTDDFPNMHSATLDIAGLVCEIVWDCSYREQGFGSAQELFRRPLTSEIVAKALPGISSQLDYLFGKVDWRELQRLLMFEAATTADARNRLNTASGIESNTKEILNEPIEPPLQAETVFRFERIGNIWHLQYHNEKTEIADTFDGLAIIARLLQKKHTPIAALELEGHDETRIPRTQTDAPTLDEPAIRDLKRKLSEIAEAMKEVEGFKDQTEYREHERRKDEIEKQLRADTGLGGKARRLSPGNEGNKGAERVRKAIAAVRKQFLKPDHNMPTLWQHLDEIKKEGAQFAYRPSSPEPNWRISF